MLFSMVLPFVLSVVALSALGIFDTGIFSKLTTLRRLLLLAVVALSARNLETGHHSVALLEVLDARSHLVYDSAELVSEDVALLELDDGAMVQVQVAAADGAAGDLEDDIAVFEDLGFGAVDCWRRGRVSIVLYANWLALIKVFSEER
jgi:hypothetical protein